MVGSVATVPQDAAPPVPRAVLDRRRTSESVTTNLIIILHLVVTLALGFYINIWLDEAYTLHTTGRGVAFAFSRALNFELQPPLYFVLMGAWRRINDSIFFARLPSVLCAALTLKVVHGLAKRYLKEMNPTLIVACGAFNPFLIWAATEIRLYALAILLSALLLSKFYDGFLIEKPPARDRWLYIIIAVSALYTQYFLGFLLLAHACALVSRRRWRHLGVYLVCMSVVAVCFAPMVLTVLVQVTDHPQGVGVPLSLLESVATIYWRVQDYLLPIEWTPLYFWRRWLLRLGFIVLLVVLIKNRRAVQAAHISLWTTTIIIAACLVVTLYFTAEMLMQSRHTVALFLPVVLAVFSLVAVTTKKRGVVAWAVISLSLSVGALAGAYTPTAKRGDWQRVAAYISAAESAGQPILVYKAMSVLPLSHYYAGKNVIVPLPEEDRLTSANYTDDNLRDAQQIIDRLDALAPYAEQVWLVRDWACEAEEAKDGCAVLEDFVEKNYVVESGESFYYSDVRLLRRREVRRTRPSRLSKEHEATTTRDL